MCVRGGGADIRTYVPRKKVVHSSPRNHLTLKSVSRNCRCSSNEEDVAADLEFLESQFTQNFMKREKNITF